MTEIQSAPFAPDVSWYLDCALEHGELDGGTHAALRLYALRSEVSAIIDDVPPIGYYLNGRPIPVRLRITARLADLADRIIAGLAADRRGAIAWAGIQHLKSEVDSLAWCLATWAIEDEIKGGCLKPYKRRMLAPWQRRYEIGPKLRRRLYGPNWVRRYVKLNDDARTLRAKGTRALSRIRGIDVSTIQAAGDILAREMRAQHENYRRWNEHIIRNLAPALRQKPEDQQRHRRILKRATSTAVAVLGPQPVSDFVAGRIVTIKGQTLDLEIGRVGSAATIGHSGIHVTAACPTTGARLADLCVYHENTPALDQFTALSMAMQAGEEAEIIKTANLSRVSDAGRAHPLIQERGLPERAWRPRDEVQLANEAYWTETRAMWTNTLGVFVLGRMWEPVCPTQTPLTHASQ